MFQNGLDRKMRFSSEYPFNIQEQDYIGSPKGDSQAFVYPNHCSVFDNIHKILGAVSYVHLTSLV